MTNKKSTKRALLFSVLSLVLCFSMLVGTTFAWFTDSVTSGNNVIISGNLDVKLEYWNGTEWADVEGKADILTNKLWEPGVVEVAYLRIKNAGSLALKYQLGININNEKEGKNVAGDPFKLSDYIKFGVVEGVNGETGAYADRTAAVAAVTNAKKISAGYTKAASMAAGAELYLALVVWMPEDVGNVANHNGTNKPQIDLGINIVATQAEAESDAFGSDYDKDTVVGATAYVESAADLATAIENAEDGDVIALTGDINFANPNSRAAANAFDLVIAKGENVTINLNGYNIIGTSTNDSGNQGVFQVKGNLTVEGEGTISVQHTGANMGWGNLSAIFSVEGGALTLGEGVTVIHNGGTDMAYAVDVNSTLGETTLNVNGAVLSSTYTGVRLFNNNKTAKAIVNLNSGVVDGTKRDIWVQNSSASAVDTNGVVNFAEGYKYTETVQTTSYNSRIYDFTDAVVVNNSEELSAAIASGATVYLTEGEYTFPSIKAGTTIIGAGDVVFTNTLSGTLDNTTIKNVHIKASNAQRWAYSKGTLVFEDCTFEATGVYAIHYDGLNGANITYKNCTIIGWAAIGGGAEHVTFDGCTIKGNGTYGLIRLYSNGTIKNCTFDVANVNTNDVYQDGIHAVDCTIKIENVVNVNGALDDILNVSGTGVFEK